MTVFTCADDFSSMMTCIYDAWGSGLGHRNIRLMTEPSMRPNFSAVTAMLKQMKKRPVK